MKHTEKELTLLREEVSQMWGLVLSQLEKARRAYLNNDAELAREVASREKRVDTYELKIDSDCENYIALFGPVAVDLRLVLSLIKISGTLERIADFADGIARHVIEEECAALPDSFKEELRVGTMFDTVISMLSDSFVALESENTKLSRTDTRQGRNGGRNLPRRHPPAGRIHAEGTRTGTVRTGYAAGAPQDRAHRRPLQQHRGGNRLLHRRQDTQAQQEQRIIYLCESRFKNVIHMDERILVVDDERTYAKYWASISPTKRYRVDTATSAEEALFGS